MTDTYPRAVSLALLSLCAASLAFAVPAHAADPAAPDEAAFARSIGLREAWQYLTREVAWPAHWSEDGRRFSYRKTVAGGFAFETVDRQTLAKSPAFDQARLAQGLSAALGHVVDPLRLPFAEFDYADGGKAIRFEIDEQDWRCELVTPSP